MEIGDRGAGALVKDMHQAVPVSDLNSSPVSWFIEPTPADPYESLAGLLGA